MVRRRGGKKVRDCERVDATKSRRVLGEMPALKYHVTLLIRGWG